MFQPPPVRHDRDVDDVFSVNAFFLNKLQRHHDGWMGAAATGELF
jgi:hypothetical protein